MRSVATALVLGACMATALGACTDEGNTPRLDQSLRGDGQIAQGDGRADGRAGDARAGDTTAAFNRYALALSSGGGYLDMGAALDFTGVTFTRLSFALWIKRRPGAASSDSALVTFDSAGTFASQVLLIWSAVGGKTALAFRVPSVAIQAEVAQPERWHHVACVYDGTTAASERTRLYLDGVRVATGSGPATIPMRNMLWVGRYRQTARHDGSLDELGIWRDSALDDQTIAAIYNAGAPTDLGADVGDYAASAALSGYFRMGDDNAGAASTVRDRANTRDASLVGTGSFVTDVP